MRRITFLFVFVAILFNFGRAQTARAYFDLGANLYIKGQTQQALQVVTEGLQKFPQDPYLKALAEKLKQKQKQEQQQQQNQQKNAQQQKQKQQEKQQARQNKAKKEQQKKERRQQQKGQKKQMSKEEAQRLLQALKEENKKFKKEHLRVPAGRRQLDKNW